MKKLLAFPLAALLCGQAAALARQQQPAAGRQPAPAAQQQQPQQRRPVQPSAGGLDLSDLGVQIAPEPRLIAVMAALDAAGWNPTPAGERPAAFRELVRRDASGLAPELRARLQDFYRRHALKEEGATPAEQSARYVSLAYTLGPAPNFEAPPRSEDLPAGVLEVLDFAPLVREFYRQTDFGERLPGYLQMHRAEGDRLRGPAAEMARSALAYLNTRPETVIVERVAAQDPAKAGDKKKTARPAAVTRERDRRFVIVPDLLAAPGAVNFRNVGDDYFAVVPAGTDPRQSELRRAYLQYVIDPLVVRFSKDVAARRDAVRQVLDAERERGGRALTPDVYLTVARSLVAAADARMDETARLRALRVETSEALKKAPDEAARAAVLKSAGEREAAVREATAALLADSYERGAVLAFYFAEQLRDLEGSGFDISNFVPAMIADIKPERESRRPAEYAEAVARVREARRRSREARSAEPAVAADPAAGARRAALVEELSAVEELLRVKNYEEAERRLLALRAVYAEEPRVYFALGQTASVAAAAAFDEDLQAERLNQALGHYRQALLFASPDSDRTVIARAHLASGRILAHFERRDEALKEFEAVTSASDAGDRLYQEAEAEKKKLGGRP